ncbi:shikimate kinase AroL [Frischella sp. Ac48]|uniref:shikimate kinase AroL n=1 Tax=Frischella sp. Ac48 TaxID=2804531 RepID=UPI001C7D8FA2|nr:shikimate kinase AroL [Frischella sp. Ac48]MBX4132933.1 shikimate kinase AroL [Frischella sp. Ac48]
MNKTIYLVGARAAGKTTMGRLLAEKLNYSFVDTDIYLFETTHRTVAEIVEKEGWEGFRKRESQVLKDVTQPCRVIATGGGMILAEQNRQYMQKMGIVFFLSAPAKILAQRLMKDPNVAQRPSLTGLSIVDEMEKVLEERHHLYMDSASHVVNVDCEEMQILGQFLDALNID